MLVIRYDVVSHEALLAASKDELIAAYVLAVMVPSNPLRKTLAHSAERFVSHQPGDWGLEGRLPASIHQKPGEGFQDSSRG